MGTNWGRNACMDCLAGRVRQSLIVKMPQHSNCCVPGCLNSFRNAPQLQYYRIPKDKKLRKTYKIILRNETLKPESSATRICSTHFEGGAKLSRNHLPSIFPWTTEKPKRKELKRFPIELALDVGIERRKKTVHEQSEVRFEVSTSEMNLEENDHKDATIQTLTLGDLICRENTEKKILLKVNDLEKQLIDLKEKCNELSNENAKLRIEVSRLN